MNREILFRGKRVDNGEWAFGYLFDDGLIDRKRTFVGWLVVTDVKDTTSDKYEIGVDFYEVDPATVSQYTGLNDKNGKKIFEGDIVHILGNQYVEDWKDVDYMAQIVFMDGGFCAIDGTVENHGMRRYTLARRDFEMEVIGNIFDNTDLIGDDT